MEARPKDSYSILGSPSAGLGASFVSSVVAHVAVVVAIYGGATWAPKFRAPPQSVLVTKMVRLGDIRPKELLPTKDVPPPPPPPPPPPSIAPAPATVAPAPKAPVTPKAPEDKPQSPAKTTAPPSKVRPAPGANRVNQALERLKRRVEGTAEGVADGEVADPNDAVIGNRYLSELHACTYRNFVIDGMDKAKIANLKAVVLVHIQPDGTLTQWRVETSSGLPAFDRFAERAVERCAKISPPPLELRQKVRRDGVLIDFTP